MSKPIPYKGSEPYIFISYAHRDSDRVWPIIEQLQRDGYRVWYDEGIDPGTEWDEFIAAHVENCGYFLAFLSPHYMASDNCKDELNFARDEDKNRLLIYLEEVKLPAGMRMRLGRLQAIFWYTYTNEADAFAKLYEAEGFSAYRGNAAEHTQTKPPQKPDRSAEEWFREGKRLAENYKTYPQAVAAYQTAAELGHREAMYELAEILLVGVMAAKDEKAAASWYHKAAVKGHIEAQYQLGLSCYIGRGTPENSEEAVYWWRMAAEQGHAEAHFCLSEMYGYAGDTEMELHWCRKAAEQGHAEAQCHLGIHYSAGDDRDQAIYWYRNAAAGGNPYAQQQLKDMGLSY